MLAYTPLGNETANHMWSFIILAVLVALLFPKKAIAKILTGILFLLVIFAIIGVAEYFIFGPDLIMIIYPCTLMELCFMYALFLSMRDLLKVVRLHKYGNRVEGTIVDVSGGRGSHYQIQYFVNGQQYECSGNRLTEKWGIGTIVGVIYSKDDPREACLEKEDLKSLIILTSVCCLLLIGVVYLECFLLMHA